MNTKTRWIWTLSGALAVILTSARAATELSGLNQDCPSCALQAALQIQSVSTQPAGDVTPTFGAISKLGYQVAPLTNPNRSFFGTALIAPVNPNIPFWDGTGLPPGAFKDSDFDFSFRAPFYDAKLGGLFNTELAPWNLFLPPDVARAWYGPIVSLPVQTANPIL